MSEYLYVCKNADYCGGGKTGQPVPQSCLDFQKDYAGHYFFACMKKIKRMQQVSFFDYESSSDD